MTVTKGQAKNADRARAQSAKEARKTAKLRTRLVQTDRAHARPRERTVSTQELRSNPANGGEKVCLGSEPTPVGVLFKAKPQDVVWKKLKGYQVHSSLTKP